MKHSSNQTNQNSPWRLRPALLIVLGIAAQAVAWPRLAEGQITNGVFVSGSSPYGRTYAEWSAAWWQWNFSLPTTNSSIQDTASISAGQSGPVWFLGTTFAASCDAACTRTRSGAIPEGTALFIAITESWADNANCPVFDNYTTAQLRSIAASYQDRPFEMSCTIDGLNTVDIYSPFNPYRVQSPVFSYSIPGVHNYLYDLFHATCFFKASGTYTITGAVADGVYLMVAPLSIESHTIHIHSAVPSSPGFPPFRSDTTYNLTVVPTPALQITRQSNNLIISWPQAASWFALQTASSLSPPNWTTSGASPQEVGGRLQMTIPIGSGNQYFRLKRI